MMVVPLFEYTGIFTRGTLEEDLIADSIRHYPEKNIDLSPQPCRRERWQGVP